MIKIKPFPELTPENVLHYGIPLTDTEITERGGYYRIRVWRYGNQLVNTVQVNGCLVEFRVL